MMKLSIKPGIGFEKIELGISKDEARVTMASLGYPLLDTNRSLDYFCDNSIQLEYENDVVRFIGVSDHQGVLCTYKGIDVFDTLASDLVDLIAKDDPNKPETGDGETYYFPGLGLNLWEADEQYDRKGNYERKIYAQVGLEKPSA